MLGMGGEVLTRRDALPAPFKRGIIVRVFALPQYILTHVAGAEIHGPVGAGSGLAQRAAEVEQGDERQKKQEETWHGGKLGSAAPRYQPATTGSVISMASWCCSKYV